MKLQYLIYGMVAYALIGFSTTYAQEDRQSRKAHQQEIQSYIESHVLPVVNPQRDKLDAILSPADRKEVSSIRTELRAMRENRPKGQRKKREEPSAEQKEELRSMMKTRRLLMTRAWAIADQHETEIAQLLESIEPEAKVWKEDIHKVKEAHRPERSKADKGQHAEHRQRHGDHPHGRDARGPRRRGMKGMNILRGIHSPVGFLLWDSSTNPFEEMQQLAIDPLSVYPNPGTNQTTISYELPMRGKVQIQVLDPQGNLVKKMVYQDQKAGKYTEQLNIEDLKKGVYIIKIQSEKNVQTQKLVVE